MQFDETIETSTTLIERHGTEVKAGHLRANIPADRSILGVLANNPMFDGETFGEDFWVYDQDGKKVRKWFTETESIKRLWPPQLERLNHIEALRQKLFETRAKHYAELTDFIHNKILVGKEKVVLFAKPLHVLKDGAGNMPGYNCWRYEVRAENKYGSTWAYGFSWRDKPDDDASEESLALGQKFYELEYRRGRKIQNRLSTVFAYLYEAVSKKIFAYDGNSFESDRKYKLTINGRDWWFHTVHNRFSYDVEVLMRPEDQNIIVLQ